MNNTFSFRRIGLILRADWIEHRRRWMLKMSLLLLAFTLLFWDYESMQDKLIGWTFFISALLFFDYMGKKIHSQKGLFLTLPASNPEKFVALWLVALFYFVSCFLVFFGVNMVSNLISGHPVVEFFNRLPNAGIVSLMVFSTCWLFASYMTFRKNAFVIGVALWIALNAGVLRIFAEFAAIGLDSNENLLAQVMKFSGEYYRIVIYLLSAALLYYSYWRLTKKRIR